jgi:RHS repeat-associated protein
LPLGNGADRLRQASGAYGTALYEYDAFDDLRRLSVGGADWRYEYTADSARLSAIRTPGGALIQSFAHDARGHMTQSRGLSGALALEYDRADTVTRVVGGESYRYDAHGRRTEVQAGPEIRQPIYTHDGVLRIEYGAAGAERYVHLDGQLIARVRGGDAQYALSDHQATPLAWANAQGQITERATYTPHGARTQGPPVRGPGYTGHVEDLSGLTYMQARYQSPVLGRMLSPDPVGAEEDPDRHFNRYAYAYNNPATLVDPDGRVPVFLVFLAKEVVSEVVEHYSGVPTGIRGLTKAGAKKIAKEGFESSIRKVPNPHGKMGGVAHQGKVAEVVKDVESRGLRAVQEYKVDTPGGNKGTRFIDVAGVDPKTGRPVEFNQVGRSKVDGSAIARERKAISDVNTAKPDIPVKYHPYDK